MKTYSGFIRDHSGSMSSITGAAANDYNTFISSTAEAARAENIDTIVSVLECGVGRGENQWANTLSSVQVLKPLSKKDYHARGSATPLWDAVGMMIEHFQTVPDKDDLDVAFLIVVTTDGGDNNSRKYTGQSIGKLVQDLRNTDRWTVVFRVPRGYASTLTRVGIPAGNIQEWDTNERGMTQSTAQTASAITGYYQARTKGINATDTFYANVANVTAESVSQANLEDVSQHITVLHVPYDTPIRPFFEAQTGLALQKGQAFYQLTKSEKAVQDYKLICVRNVKTGAIYTGYAARSVLGIPHVGTHKIAPSGSNSEWDVYIQSTSVNRKLIGGTSALFFPNYNNFN